LTNCLPWALEYAARGLVVLPLLPQDKEAREKGQYCDCSGKTVQLIGSTDPEWIRARWMRQPAANLGVVCGGRSGLLVMDVDVKRQGIGDLQVWTHDRQDEGKYLPPTVSYTTATGGRHIWYRLPAGLHLRRNDYWLRGVEIKACGGYVAVPPSTRVVSVEMIVEGFVVQDDEVRAYEWESGTTGIAEAPAWLLEDVRLRHDGIGRSRTGGVKQGRNGDGVRIELPRTEEFLERGLGWFYLSRNEDAYHLAWRCYVRLGKTDPGAEAVVLEVIRRCWEATSDKSDSSWYEIRQAAESARSRLDREYSQLRQLAAKISRKT
jgi:hypothetical protein